MDATALIDLPCFREAPPSVLEALREIDPTAELVYVGEGRWWLGVVSTPNRFRRRTAERLIAGARRRGARAWAALRQGTLALAGFTFIAEYPQPNADGAIVEDFRRRDWEYRFAPLASAYHAEEARIVRRERGDGAKSFIREKLAADGKRIFRRFIRGDKQISLSRGPSR